MEASGAAAFWKRLNELYEKLIRIVLILALLIVAWYIYDAAYVYNHTLDKSVKGYKPVPGGDNRNTADSPITDDMVAWLTIDDTNIDYPIMQGRDNTEYLNTDPFGQYSLSGSIFLDSRSSPDFSDDYSLVYGHHMEYGKMFGAIDDFLDEKYLKAHDHGTLMIGRTADRSYDLEVFAALSVSAADKEIFQPGEGWDARRFIAARTGLELRNQRILALSTCTEGDQLSRLVVFCYILD